MAEEIATLADIEGITNRQAYRLYGAGIITLADLADANPTDVARIARGVGPNVAAGWQATARRLMGDSDEPQTTNLTKIDGVGPATAEKLRQAGIVDFASLADADAVRVAEVTAQSTDRVAEWQAQAARLREKG